jgi:hypothetical protein
MSLEVCFEIYLEHLEHFPIYPFPKKVVLRLFYLPHYHIQNYRKDAFTIYQ